MAANHSSDNLMGAVKASGAGLGGSVAEQLNSLAAQLEQLNATNDLLAQQATANAAPAGTAVASGGSVLDAIGSAWGGGLGLTSLVTGLLGLFGNGGDSAPPPVTPYIAPLPVLADAGFSNAGGGAAFGVDSAQGNTPRPMTSGAQQITIQVQAMDSQGFLDRSQEIALAVRQAMLESTVLNDVIRDV